MSQTSVSLPQTYPAPTPVEEVAAPAPRVRWTDRVSALSRVSVAVWLLAILLMAAGFRFVGLDWDDGQHLHPDERFLTMVEAAMRWPQSNFISTYFDEATSTLNPRNVGHQFFVYGDFPVILVKAVSEWRNMAGYDQVHLVGRAVTALFDLATVLMVFLVARRLYGDRRVALLATFFYAASALAIQQAHFFVVDSFTAFFATVAVYFTIGVFQRGGIRDYLLAGGFCGMAVASKISVYSIVAIVAVAAAYRLYLTLARRGDGEAQSLDGVRGADRRSAPVSVEQIVFRAILAGVAAFVVFRVFQPYAFETPSLTNPLALSDRWLANAFEARAWNTGEREAPFAWQWTNRAAIVFPLQNMVLWGLGIPLGLAAWAGWAVAGWRLVRHREWIHLVPFAWVGILFGLLGVQWVKSLRYFLPIYPMLAIFAGWFLVWAWDRTRARVQTRVWPRWTLQAVTATLGLVTVGTLLYAVAFTSIYMRPHTRVEASHWIFANIPQGAVIANETPWDDGLPLRVDGRDGFGGYYRGITLDITAEDNPQKLQMLLDRLGEAEYLVISSNRQYDSMSRLPMRFPMTMLYYDALFGGRLGFERVAEFTSYPSLLGLRLPDQSAEEAWTVYDHPRVQIFRKTSEYSREQSAAILGDVGWESIQRLSPHQATFSKGGLMLTLAMQEVYEEAGTWSAMFDMDGWANRLPVPFWAFAVFLIGLAAVPYLWLAGSSLPDRGYALAKPVGLLLVGWLVWMIGSLRLLPFTWGSIALSLVLVAAGGALLVGMKTERRRTFGQWLRTRWRMLLLIEGLYWLFFGVVLAIRWANPDLWHPVLGGEKPMDFSYLNAVVKSAYFPPYDPWFAGGYINYYYFGFVLVATLVKLTGVAPQIAYNLALPTFFAFLGVGAFGAALALLGGRVERVPVGRRPVLFALLGAVFVAVAGNLAQVGVILKGVQDLGQTSIRSSVPVVEGLLRTWDGFFNGVLAGRELPVRIEWWYWNATRVISHAQGEAGPITEMPWFSFLYADLHAHVMALPYTVCVVGVVLAIVRSARRGAHGVGDGGRTGGVLRMGLLALLIGSLWPLNTWDFPTYGALALAGFALYGWGRHGAFTPALFLEVVGRWLLVLVVGYLLFLPFHQNYGSAVSGFELWKGSKTPLSDYLIIHGFFLFSITAGLLADFWHSRDANGAVRFVRLGWDNWYRLPRMLHLHSLLVRGSARYGLTLNLLGGAIVAVVGLSLLRENVSALIVALMTLTALLFFRQPRGRARWDEAEVQRRLLWQMALMMIFGGLALTLLVEYVVLKGVDIARMNTVFKFYLQVWVLWGLAAAVMAASVFSRLPRFQPEWRVVWQAGFAILFAATLLYPVLSTRAKIEDRFDKSVGPTLDGMAFMDKAIHRDRDQPMALIFDKEAMRWMQENVPGSPVVAEANTNPVLYGWGARFAMFTGNPAPIGWGWHQQQQRAVLPGDLIGRRIQDVQKAYGTTDPSEAHAIFQRYGVEYIVVGQLERAYFPQGQGKWSGANGRLWELVYENPGTQIYRMIEPTTARSNDRGSS